MAFTGLMMTSNGDISLLDHVDMDFLHMAHLLSGFSPSGFGHGTPDELTDLPSLSVNVTTLLPFSGVWVCSSSLFIYLS